MEVMKLDDAKINEYLTAIFNNVLIIEESSLRSSRFSDVSIKEMHTIDVVGEKKRCYSNRCCQDLNGNLGNRDNQLE